MRDKLATFSLFMPEEMSEQDHNNRAVAGIHRVQLFLGVGYNRRGQLHRLAAEGVSVIFRIEEPSRDNPQEVNGSYYTADGRARIARQLSEIQASVPGLVVEAVVAGNEPEIEYTLLRGVDDWGDKPEPNFSQGRVWEHRFAVGELRRLLAPLVVVAPGWSDQRLTPRHSPQPGRMTWARIVADVYNGGPAGLHAYSINYSGPAGPEDENRLLWYVGNELERIHGEAWINEINVATHALDGQPVVRMQMVMAMYDLLAAQPWSEPIKSFCPFVSNGRADQPWSNMIMRDPAAYVELGRWMAT